LVDLPLLQAPRNGTQADPRPHPLRQPQCPQAPHDSRRGPPAFPQPNRHPTTEPEEARQSRTDSHSGRHAQAHPPLHPC
jgi:hypothetical protein